MIAESLARRYAAALFRLAGDRNERERIFGEFALFIAALKRQEKFRYFFFSPKIGTEEKKEVLRSIFGDEMSQTMYNFVYLLLDKKRQTLILKMYDHFETLYNSSRRKAVVTVRPASLLDRKTRGKIQSLFEKTLGKTVTVNEEVDPTLLGGFQIRVNNTLYDASVATRLKTMKKLLLT